MQSLYPLTKSNLSQEALQESDSLATPPASDPSQDSSSQSRERSFTLSSMPDTPAATPESLQYASIGRSSSTSTSSFPSGPQLEVSHRPTFSARAFMVELFPALEDKLFSARGNGKSKKSKNRGLKEGWLAEDAGVELIENCHGWRGAVLDRNGAVMRKAGRGDSEKRVLYVSMPLGSGNKTSGGIEPQSNLNKESTSSNLSIFSFFKNYSTFLVGFRFGFPSSSLWSFSAFYREGLVG